MKINLGKVIAGVGRVGGPVVKSTGAALATALVTAAAQAAIDALNKPKGPKA